MPTKRQSNSYKYRTNDIPITVANQFGIPPSSLLAANPGAFPFSTGQTINVPYGPPKPFSYGGQNNVGPAFGPPKPSTITGVPPVGYGPAGYGQPKTPQPTGPNSFLSGGQNLASYYNQNIMTLNSTPTQQPSTGIAPTQQPAPVLPYGQYVNAQGNVSQGTTPFGTNAAGQRLDINGQAWDPTTATQDIYGGRFIQPGEKKWERIGGKLRRVQYLSNGKKTILKGGGGGGQQQQQASPVSQDAITVANSFISFGVSSG
jgi:hypothetical protein